jgi:hypothetical protein
VDFSPHRLSWSDPRLHFSHSRYRYCYIASSSCLLSFQLMSLKLPVSTTFRN